MKDNPNNENFNPYDYLLDFSDKDHLIFSDESYLDKRILPLESAINMRDIGGYTNNNNEQIKWNKIIRGEQLLHLSEEDQEKFNNLGFTHVIDFREPHTAQKRKDKLPPNVEYLNIPLLKDFGFIKIDYANPKEHIDFMHQTYMHQVKNSANEIAKALKILADNPDAKIYVHCTNGKDRTGFFIALLMLLAGIDEEKIISDYSLTNLTVSEAQEIIGVTMAEDVGIDLGILRNFFGVDPEWLKLQLNYIKDNYGTVENYLLSNTDLNKEDLENIKKNILEPKQ